MAGVLLPPCFQVLSQESFFFRKVALAANADHGLALAASINHSNIRNVVFAFEIMRKSQRTQHCSCSLY